MCVLKPFATTEVRVDCVHQCRLAARSDGFTALGKTNDQAIDRRRACRVAEHQA